MSNHYSDYTENPTKENIRNSMTRMTNAERNAAAFFLDNSAQSDFSSKSVSSRLFISEATLSRFAKKCGYRGYREFIYSYEQDLAVESALRAGDQEQNIQMIAKKVEASYYRILQESFRHLNAEAIKRTAALVNAAQRVKVIGLGSSGFAAREFQLRFMRTGLEIEAITDSQVIQMSAAIADPKTLMIGISLSGRSRVITDSLVLARQQGASTVLFTSAPHFSRAFCDEIIVLSSMKNLDTGTRISPQFPILVIFDVLYSYCYANDSRSKTQKVRATLSVISEERSENE